MTDTTLAAALRDRGLPGRPLDDEPLGLDLLNTHWSAGPDRVDLLEDATLTRAWLDDHALPVGATAGVRAALREARDTLAAVIAGEESYRALDALLAAGRVRVTVDEHGRPGEAYEVTDPSWHAAWRCVRDFVLVAGTDPERVRRCANPECTLHFHDTSKTGRRRWCSMASCGNRLKARRHQDRTRGGH